MKVAVTDYIEDDLNWEAEQLKAAGIGFAAFQLKFKPEEEVAAAEADADMLVVNMVKITDSLLARLPKCKLIIRHGIGYDNVDVAACTKRGIQFAYQPDYCKEDVAEHAIALILACARKLFPARRTLEDSSRTGQWDFSKLFPIPRGAGKTVGVLGVGRIGSRVCHKLKSFGFILQGCDPYLSDRRKADVGVPFVDRETLFRTSDFVTVHTALNEETRCLVNEQSLGWMKPTAYLINTARAGMVDTAALVKALREKRLAGAAIDVFEVEPPPPTLPLFEMENVILTPHIGWASVEAGQEIRQSILNDLLAFAKGQPARCVVNKDVLKRV
jgi:D-3-phosphoglycerate dehydrogenase